MGSKGTNELRVEISVLKFCDIRCCLNEEKYQKQFCFLKIDREESSLETGLKVPCPCFCIS